MRILMLGWEFPPHISGGLGTACYGLTKALSDAGVEVVFVLPRVGEGELSAEPDGSVEGIARRLYGEMPGVTFKPLDVGLMPYQLVTARRGGENEPQSEPRENEIYSADLFASVDQYTQLACAVAEQERFDLIHAHDWMTFPAAVAIHERTGQPLVVQIHSTEFDRSGENANQRICHIEQAGCLQATRVIAVSVMTKNILTRRYWVPARLIDVVYNAAEGRPDEPPGPSLIGRREKIVLFLGRITMQKGPEYFLAAARKVLEIMQDVRFVMAGSGDLIRGAMDLAGRMGIKDKVTFTGFLRGQEVDRVYQGADVYVMPSVSEPFGIAPLEALCHDVPVIISKQSGVAEVLKHVLKVDFWDTTDMANKIVAVLRHTPLRRTLQERGGDEARMLSWADSGQKCLEVYRRALAAVR